MKYVIFNLKKLIHVTTRVCQWARESLDDICFLSRMWSSHDHYKESSHIVINKLSNVMKLLRSFFFDSICYTHFFFLHHIYVWLYLSNFSSREDRRDLENALIVSSICELDWDCRLIWNDWSSTNWVNWSLKENESMTTSNLFDAKLDKLLALENIDSMFDSRRWFVVENDFEVSWMISRFETMRRCSKDLVRDNVELSNVSLRRLIAFLSKIDDIENEKTMTNRMFLSIEFIVDSKSRDESSLKNLNFLLFRKYDLSSKIFIFARLNNSNVNRKWLRIVAFCVSIISLRVVVEFESKNWRRFVIICTNSYLFRRIMTFSIANVDENFTIAKKK